MLHCGASINSYIFAVCLQICSAFPVDIYNYQAYLPARFVNIKLANNMSRKMQCKCEEFNRLSNGLGQAMARPGSWERSRVKRNRRPLTRTLPSRRSGGFFISGAGSFILVRRKPERETRIPGLAQACACPKRGACRRERGASRIPMAERTRRVRNGGAGPESAAIEFRLQSLCRIRGPTERWW